MTFTIHVTPAGTVVQQADVSTVFATLAEALDFIATQGGQVVPDGAGGPGPPHS